MIISHKPNDEHDEEELMKSPSRTIDSRGQGSQGGCFGDYI